MRDSKRDTDVLSSLLVSVGEGKGGMIWENGIETCKISYVKLWPEKKKVECGKEESVIYLRGQGEPQRYEDRSFLITRW